MIKSLHLKSKFASVLELSPSDVTTKLTAEHVDYLTLNGLGKAFSAGECITVLDLSIKPVDLLEALYVHNLTEVEPNLLERYYVINSKFTPKELLMKEVKAMNLKSPRSAQFLSTKFGSISIDACWPLDDVMHNKVHIRSSNMSLKHLN